MKDVLGSNDGSPLPPSRVLIVDDNQQNLELLLAYVEELDGVTIATAQNGIDAMEKVAKFKPDLVLLDVMMPKMSGFEVCKNIKADPATRDITVVMVTALNESADLERGTDCGTDDFLTKPVNRLELVERIKSLLRVSHLKKELQRAAVHLDEAGRPRTSRSRAADRKKE